VKERHRGKGVATKRKKNARVKLTTAPLEIGLESRGGGKTDGTCETIRHNFFRRWKGLVKGKKLNGKYVGGLLTKVHGRNVSRLKKGVFFVIEPMGKE